MADPQARPLTAHCALGGAALSVTFDASAIELKLSQELEKRLGKKGIQLVWQNSPETAELRVRFVELDQGNRFLRYMLPFISPAVAIVEGELAAAGSAPVPFNFTRKAQFGLFGGSAQGMLQACAVSLAADIAKGVVRQLG